MSGFLGLGDLLYESADIAFDTASHLFVNPKAGTTYGPNPPAGGWPISWYQDSSGQVQVPVGIPGAVAQTQADAQALAQTVVTQLAAQGKAVTAPVLAQAATTPTPATTLPPVAASLTPGSDFIYTIPSTNATIDLTQLWANYWWVLLGAGAVFLMARRRRR